MVRSQGRNEALIARSGVVRADAPHGEAGRRHRSAGGCLRWGARRALLAKHPRGQRAEAGEAAGAGADAAQRGNQLARVGAERDRGGLPRFGGARQRCRAPADRQDARRADRVQDAAVAGEERAANAGNSGPSTARRSLSSGRWRSARQVGQRPSPRARSCSSHPTQTACTHWKGRAWTRCGAPFATVRAPRRGKGSRHTGHSSGSWARDSHALPAAGRPRFPERRIHPDLDRRAYWEVAARQANETSAVFTTAAIHADVSMRASAQRDSLDNAPKSPEFGGLVQ